MKISDKDFKLLKQLAACFIRFPNYSIQKISLEIGVNKSSIHRIFGTKEDISWIINTIATTELDSMCAIIDNSHDMSFIDKFRFLAQKINEIKELIIYNMILCSTHNEKEKFLQKVCNSLDLIFQKGQSKGLLKIEISYRLITDLFIACLHGISISISSGRTTSNNSLEEFEQLFLNGIMR
ncbi:MAG: hypothetical protein ACRC42_04810 [Mycoplasma sp.]